MQRYRWRQQEAIRRRTAAEAGRQRAAAERPVKPFTSSPDPIPDLALAGLGKLALLPNEVILTIFDNCSLRSLLRLERVNKATKDFVSLLHNIGYVRETVKGIIQRAQPPFRKIMFTISKITTYHGLRYLLTTNTCEMCGKPGSFRMVKVKVLCETCHSSKKLRSN